LADSAAEAPRTRQTLIQAEDVPCHIIETNAFCHLFLAIGNKGFHYRCARRRFRSEAVKPLIYLRQKIRIAVDLPSEHDSIHFSEQCFTLVQGGDAAINNDLELW